MLAEEDIIITSKAEERMQAEGLSIQHIIQALEQGAKRPQGSSWLSAYGYYSVSYTEIGSKFKIKTVFLNH